jgi:hypothetical protein
MLYDEYGWRFCGTITPTEKLSRQDRDVPFAKLSKGGLNSVPRCWMREVGLQQKTRSGCTYWIQCTSWKDRKQVMFLHTTDIGCSRGKHSVKRSRRGVRGRETIQVPASQQSYVESFSAVDRNDRDSSDYTTSILTNRFYLRLLFWLPDRVIHTSFQVVSWVARPVLQWLEELLMPWGLGSI